MSRPYRILVRRVVEKEVVAEDTSTLRLDLDEAVSEEQLARALEREGWTEREPGVWEKERADGETMSCDLAEREVTTTITVGTTLREERERELRGDTWNWRDMREMTAEEMAALRAAEEAKLSGDVSDYRVRQTERKLRAGAAEQLEAGSEDRRREVNRVVIEALAESLKERAATLGQVVSSDNGQWQGDEFELTITIRE